MDPMGLQFEIQWEPKEKTVYLVIFFIQDLCIYSSSSKKKNSHDFPTMPPCVQTSKQR